MTSVEGTVRLRGTQFQAMLVNATQRELLTAALISDLARLLQVLASRVRIRALSLGSLIVDYSVAPASSTAADPVAEQQLVARANSTLAAAMGSEVFVDTSALYRDRTNSTESLVLESSNVVAGDAATPAPSPASSSLFDVSSCGTMCGGFIAVAAVAAIGVAVAVVLVVRHRRRRSTGQRPTKAGDGLETNPVSADHRPYA